MLRVLRQRLSFPLIELLVVIAIIAILAAALFRNPRIVASREFIAEAPKVLTCALGAFAALCGVANNLG